jgi:uncharacterized protein (DUF2235 family)
MTIRFRLADISQVFFAGNHGDVGGGWTAGSESDVQLSDLVLEWMLKEIEDLPEPPEERLSFNVRRTAFMDNVEQKRSIAIQESVSHDALRFGKGWVWPQVIFWWIFGRFRSHARTH